MEPWRAKSGPKVGQGRGLESHVKNEPSKVKSARPRCDFGAIWGSMLGAILAQNTNLNMDRAVGGVRRFECEPPNRQVFGGSKFKIFEENDNFIESFFRKMSLFDK